MNAVLFIIMGIALAWAYKQGRQSLRLWRQQKSPLDFTSLANGPREVTKPWGFETIWAENDRYLGKILHINAGHRLSLQYHREKDETIYLMKGILEFYMKKGGAEFRSVLYPGDCCRIAPHTIHRMSAIEDCDVFEASTPELHDVVRLEDDYQR